MGSQVWDSPTQRRESAIPESWAQRSQERPGLSREVHHAGRSGAGRTGRERVRAQPRGTVCSMSLVSDLPITTHVLACSDVTKSQ